MNIYESGQDYLEAILVLSKTNSNIRSIDVANHLSLTKQSVHRAIKNFKEEGYINVDEKNYITLTKKGLEIAEKVYERHIIISKFLMSLGVDEKTALKDACKMEHDISDESFNKMKEIVKKGSI